MPLQKASIYAAYTSPGPKYKLQSLTGSKKHESNSLYKKAPSFSFGSRHNQYPVGISPGPNLPQTSIYRNGREGSPKYSLKSRFSPKKQDNVPSPIIYNLDKSKSQVYRSSPKHSISFPLRSRFTDTTPAPKYKLPSTLCETKESNKKRYPAYSMSFKSRSMGKSDSPGPAVYNVISPNIYLNKSPAYSLYFRNRNHKAEPVPGPGSHRPERVWAHKKKEPQFSFGVRHSMYINPLMIKN